MHLAGRSTKWANFHAKQILICKPALSINQINLYGRYSFGLLNASHNRACEPTFFARPFWLCATGKYVFLAGYRSVGLLVARPTDRTDNLRYNSYLFGRHDEAWRASFARLPVTCAKNNFCHLADVNLTGELNLTKTARLACLATYMETAQASRNDN